MKQDEFGTNTTKTVLTKSNTSNQHEKNSSKEQSSSKHVEHVVSLEACDYVRNFGLTQCGCAT